MDFVGRIAKNSGDNSVYFSLLWFEYGSIKVLSSTPDITINVIDKFNFNILYDGVTYQMQISDYSLKRANITKISPVSGSVDGTFSVVPYPEANNP